VRWQLRGVCYIDSKRHELWSTNSFKIDRHFYQPYVNSAFYVTARLRRRRSANRTQPYFAKRRMVNRANNLLQNSWGRPPRKKWGSINFNICSVFQRLRHLMANIFWMKRDIDNRARALESMKVALSKNLMNFGLQTASNGTGHFPHPHHFVLCQSNKHLLIGINVAPHSNSKWNGTGFVCSSDSKPQRCWIGNAVASGGLKRQYIAIIATFSSWTCFALLRWDVIGGSLSKSAFFERGGSLRG